MHRQRVALFALAQILDRPLVRQVRVDARQRDREIDRLGDVVVRPEPRASTMSLPCGAP